MKWVVVVVAVPVTVGVGMALVAYKGFLEHGGGYPLPPTRG